MAKKWSRKRSTITKKRGKIFDLGFDEKPGETGPIRVFIDPDGVSTINPQYSHDPPSDPEFVYPVPCVDNVWVNKHKYTPVGKRKIFSFGDLPPVTQDNTISISAQTEDGIPIVEKVLSDLSSHAGGVYRLDLSEYITFSSKTIVFRTFTIVEVSFGENVEVVGLQTGQRTPSNKVRVKFDPSKDPSFDLYLIIDLEAGTIIPTDETVISITY